MGARPLFGVAYNHLATDGAGVELEVNGVKVPGEDVEPLINMQWISIRGGVTVFFGGNQ